MEVVLASKSPRRRELMQLLDMAFTVRVADVAETLLPNATPAEQASHLSYIKAKAVAKSGEIVIGADTIVVLGDRILGKPKDKQEAAQMLRLLSGNTHQVMTGVTVISDRREVSCTEVTEVTFRQLTENEILRYVDTLEPMDKAGAYGIQGGAAKFVEGIRGDYFNVVGLPVCKLSQILRDFMEETQ